MPFVLDDLAAHETARRVRMSRSAKFGPAAPSPT